MTTENDTESLVRRVLCNDAQHIRTRFTDALGNQLERFIPAMASALQASGEFDEFAIGDEARNKVGCMIFSAVQGHLISMRLLLDGFLIQSGNAQRQVIESIAMAILFSKPDLGFLRRFDNDEYTANYAIRDVKRNSNKLGVSKDTMQILENHAKFYHLFSHPSKMTIAFYEYYAEPQKSLIGGIFDPAKIARYKVEAKMRIGLAEVLPNFVLGVRMNLIDAA